MRYRGSPARWRVGGLCGVLMAGVLTVAGLPAAATAISRPIDLGTLDGGTDSHAYGVYGNIVVGYSTYEEEEPLGEDPPKHAFAYDLTTGEMTDLGTLGGRNSAAYGVYGDTVVGYANYASLPGPAWAAHAFAYDLTTGEMTDLGTLGGTHSIAYSVYRDTVVGSSDHVPGVGSRHGFAYDLTTGEMTDLGTLGGTESVAYGVYGNIVVGESDLPGDSAEHAFVYDLATGEMTDLGTLGGTYSAAYGVSGNTVVGYASLPGDLASRAFAYDLATGEMTDLAVPGSTARGVSGDTVVGSFYPSRSHGWQHGFVYDLATGEMTDLGTLGDTYSAARGVSGNTVVGSSRTLRGDTDHAVAWKLDAIPPTIKRARAVPNPFDISEDRVAEFRMRISENAATRFLVKRNGAVVKRFPPQPSPRGLVTQNWRGRNDAGRLVRRGDYVVVMRAKDPAGNLRTVRVGLRVTR